MTEVEVHMLSSPPKDLQPAKKVRLGQTVWVRCRFTSPPYGFYYQRGTVEVVRRRPDVAVVRVHSYQLLAPLADVFVRG